MKLIMDVMLAVSIGLLRLSAFPVYAQELPTITIFPKEIFQGDPVRITIANVLEANNISGIYLENQPLNMFPYEGRVIALTGIDIKKSPGTYKVKVTFYTGVKIEKEFEVKAREKIETTFSIPEKLGGNTPLAAAKLMSSLSLENARLLSARTFPRTLWTSKFIFPVSNPVVTDSYGYSRRTVGQSILHKGTDFKAPLRTPVYAINRGIIRIARVGASYGKTILVDHGLGLSSIYLHLSKIKVNEGELVKKGQLIAYSGDTGYAEAPHLHLSVWIKGVAIDPMKFMSLF